MPAIGNITINDATPTAVVFTPRKASPEQSIWAKNGYSTNTFAASDAVIKVGVSPPSAKRPTTRASIELSFPDPDYSDTDTDPMSVARFYGTAIVPDNFSATSRGHFEALIQNLMADAVVTAAVEDGEGSY